MSDDFDDHPSAHSHTVTRRALAEAVYSRLPALSRREAKALVETIFDEIADALSRDGQVKLRGFGALSVREKRERAGRNPKTGIPAVISARKVVTFHPSPAMKSRLSGAAGKDSDRD